MVKIYHGTHSGNLENVLENGFVARDPEDKFDGLDKILAKYVAPEFAFKEGLNALLQIMADKEHEIDPYDDYNLFRMRMKQARKGRGIFYSFADEREGHSDAYAKSAASHQSGEAALMLRNVLDRIMNKKGRWAELYSFFDGIISKKFQGPNNYYYFGPKEKPNVKPIVFECDVSQEVINRGYTGHADKQRLNDSVPLEQITGIGYADGPIMSVEEFLKQDIERVKNGETLPYDPEKLLKRYHRKMKVKDKDKEKTEKHKLQEILKAATKGNKTTQKVKFSPVNGGNEGM